MSFVLGLTFGVHLALFLASARIRGFQSTITFTDRRLVTTVLYEIGLLVILGLFLQSRGWTPECFPLRVSSAGTLFGVGLWLGSYLLYVLSYSIAYSILGPGASLSRIAIHGRVGLLATLLLCLVNPLFEELLCLGYVVRVLEGHGSAFAISASALLRLLAHTYQGPLAVVSILPMGLLFAAYYWRGRQLWPPVFAHVIADFVGLQSLT